MALEKELTTLLQDVQKKDAKIKKRVFTASLLPIIFAVALLYYFTEKITSSRRQVNLLNLKVDSLQTTLKDYDNRIDSIKKVYSGIEFNFIEDFGWTPKDVITKDSAKILLSQKAHQKIIEALKLKKINIKTTIRYYTKISDKEKVDETLLKCGFRNIKVFTKNYNDKNHTNTINYSLDVSDENIKVIAYALLRTGLDLKELSPYPNSMQAKKHNSIEISGNAKYDDKKSISIEEIQSFHK